MNKQHWAHLKVRQAIDKGILIRPDVCELCGVNVVQRNEMLKRFGFEKKRPMTFAHHFNGYDDPLNIWWICPSCNSQLAGKHDGTLSLEEARQIVTPYDIDREETAWKMWDISVRRHDEHQEWLNLSLLDILIKRKV